MNFQKNIRRRETSCVPCQKNAWLEYFILHTGQHHSYNIDRVFFEQLGLPEARYNLEAGSGAHGEQTGKMMAGIGNMKLRFRNKGLIFKANKYEIYGIRNK